MKQFNDLYGDYEILSPVLRQIQPAAETLFRDVYTLDFLGLSPNHSEYDLRNGIVHSLKKFIIEFGRDFAFIGEEYRAQVLNYLTAFRMEVGLLINFGTPNLKFERFINLKLTKNP